MTAIPGAGPRLAADELLDARGHDPEELRRSLALVSEVDRWLGGARALRRHLGPLLEGRRDRVPFAIVDVGTGDARVLRATLAWAARADGGPVRGVGVDLHPQVAPIARDTLAPVDAAGVVRADGLRLPFPDGAFDVALSTLTLHHFDESDAVAVVAEMARVARRRVLVGDLERHPLAWLGARALAATRWRSNRITRNDGPISVLRSFRASELLRIGRAAGLADAAVHRHRPFRLVLEGTPP